MSAAQPNQSVIAGLTCLQEVISSPVPLGSMEVAERLAMEPTRVNRLLKTLVSMGMLAQLSNRLYAPGPGLHVLAAQATFGSGLLQAALPTLESLRSTGLGVALGVLWGDRVAYQYWAGPNTPIHEAIGNTELLAAEQSSIGLVLQAVNGSIPNNDIVCRGYAVAKDPHGNRSLAVALGQPAIAAVALAGRCTLREIKSYAPELKRAAETINAVWQRAPYENQ